MPSKYPAYIIGALAQHLGVSLEEAKTRFDNYLGGRHDQWKSSYRKIMRRQVPPDWGREWSDRREWDSPIIFDDGPTPGRREVPAWIQEITDNWLRNNVPRRPEACQDCAHYYGKTYGGNLLVCAMHPYGADGECPDKEITY